MNYRKTDSYFSPQFVEEFGLLNSLQLNITPLDWAENPDDAYNEEIHPTYVLGNEGLPSNSDPSGLSMGSSGQLYFPGTVSHEPCGNNSYPHPNPSYVEPAQYNHASHALKLDAILQHVSDRVHKSVLHRLGVGGVRLILLFVAKISIKNVASQRHLLSNSQTQLPRYHIDTETLLNDNVSPYDVRQSYQEPGYLPASDYEFNGRVSDGYPLDTLVQGVAPVTHDSQPSENIYPKTAATTTANILSTLYFSNLNRVSDSHDSSLSPRYQDPLPATSSFFTSPSYPLISTDTTLPPVIPAPYSYPCRDNNLPPQGAQLSQIQSSSLYPMPELTQNTSTVTIPTASHPYNPIQSRSCDPSPSSSFSSPPYPITPVDNTTAPITSSSKPTFLPARQISKRIRPSLPFKKRARTRTPKKASPPALVPATIKRHEQKQKRELPNKRAAVRSQGWLDKYYPNRGPCTLCKEKKEGEGEGEENVPAWRRDRVLEHLVSSHIIQVVKNMETFEKGVLNENSTHLLETESQFAFARNEMKKMRCSLCPTVSTSLVFRGSNIKDHLRKVHAELPKSVLQKELKRVRALMPDRTEWYSYQDKFLHYFPKK